MGAGSRVDDRSHFPTTYDIDFNPSKTGGAAEFVKTDGKKVAPKKVVGNSKSFLLNNLYVIQYISALSFVQVESKIMGMLSSMKESLVMQALVAFSRKKPFRFFLLIFVSRFFSSVPTQQFQFGKTFSTTTRRAAELGHLGVYADDRSGGNVGTKTHFPNYPGWTKSLVPHGEVQGLH